MSTDTVVAALGSWQQLAVLGSYTIDYYSRSEYSKPDEMSRNVTVTERNVTPLEVLAAGQVVNLANKRPRPKAEAWTRPNGRTRPNGQTRPDSQKWEWRFSKMRLTILKNEND